MVVFIVGINLAGYIGYKFLGSRAGILLGGLLGGLVSSTATTVSFSRRAASSAEAIRAAVVVITIASGVVVVRVIVELGVVSTLALRAAAMPLGIYLALFAAICAGVWISARNSDATLPEQGNPTELKSALLFALLYAIVLVAVSVARKYFGQGGLYVVAGLSGLTDVDAITLSTAQLVRMERLAADQAWRVVLIATTSNLAFKMGVAGVLGGRRLVRRLSLPIGLAIGGAVALFLFYP